MLFHPLSEQVTAAPPAVRIGQYPLLHPVSEHVRFVFSPPIPSSILCRNRSWMLSVSPLLQVTDAVSVTPCSRSRMLSVSPLLQVTDAVSVTPASGHGCCQCHPCSRSWMLSVSPLLHPLLEQGFVPSSSEWSCWGVLFRHCLGGLVGECCSVIALVALLKSFVPSLPEWSCWGVLFRHRLSGLAGECCSVIA